MLWYLASHEKVAQKGKKVGIFAAGGILSFFLSAVWTIPSFLATQSGREGMTPFSPDTNVTYNIRNIYQKFFIGQFDGITNTARETAGTPSIFCSVAILLLVVGYFFSKKISVREKLASGAMLLVFALSMAIGPLDKMWHIFAYPNWFPCRWAFVAVFFAVFLASRALTESDIWRITLGSFAAWLVLFILYLIHRQDFSYPKLAVLSLVMVIFYGALLQHDVPV